MSPYQLIGGVPFVRHEVPDLLIEHATNAWLHLLRTFEPWLLKETALKFLDSDITPDGYTRREEEGKDDKHYLHFRRSFEEHPKIQSLCETYPALSQFVSGARALHDALVPASLSVLDVFDKCYPRAGLRQHFLDEHGQPLLIVRFLAYTTPPASNEILAKEHRDASGFTLHVHASHRGLEIKKDGRWICAPEKHGMFQVITGLELTRLADNALSATEHRVIATGGDPITPEINACRTAIVGFVDPRLAAGRYAPTTT